MIDAGFPDLLGDDPKAMHAKLSSNRNQQNQKQSSHQQFPELSTIVTSKI